MLILTISKNHNFLLLWSMKRGIKTIKEERMKLQTFGALRWVESPQNLKNGGSSSLKRHGEEEARALSNVWLGLVEEEGMLIYSKSISTSWWLQLVLNLYILYQLEPLADTKWTRRHLLPAGGSTQYEMVASRCKPVLVALFSASWWLQPTGSFSTILNGHISIEPKHVRY